VGAPESIRHLWKEFRGLLLVGSNSIFLDCLWITGGCLGWQIHSPPVKAVSGAISEWAMSQFSLTVYESIGVVWADESIYHLWKQFQVPFQRRQRLSFSWLFMSKKGLSGQTNPFVTYERRLGGYFWLGTESVFLDCLWVKRGCVGWRIHSSPVKGVSGAIFDAAATQFSLTVNQITRVVGADESIHHLWKEFRGLLRSGQLLSFTWLLMSQKGLCGKTNPFVTSVRSFGGLFDLAASQFFLTVNQSTGAVGADESIRPMWKEFRGLLLSGQQLSFPRLFMSHQGLFRLLNLFATCESSFGGYIWMGSESIFLDCLWVNRSCVGWRIHSSPVKAISWAVSERATTQFYMTVYKWKGAEGQTNPFVTC